MTAQPAPRQTSPDKNDLFPCARRVYVTTLPVMTGFTFLSRLTQIASPHTRFVFHVFLQGTFTPRRSPMAAYSRARFARRCAIGIRRPWTRHPLTGPWQLSGRWHQTRTSGLR